MDHARKSVSLTDNLNEPGEAKMPVDKPGLASSRLTFQLDSEGSSRHGSIDETIPNPSKWWVRAFAWYGLRYVRKHFNAVRLSRSGTFPDIPDGTPVVVYLNHASWWDPMIGMVAWHFLFRQRKVFTPIDADALEQYKFFKKLGFFGVTPGKAIGARQFIRASKSILCPGRNSLLMVTPQGRFADVRERPLKFLPGLGTLALKFPGVLFIPMSLEYCFWNEKKPEALIRFGTAVSSNVIQQTHSDLKSSSNYLESQLLKTMDQLQAEAIQRDKERFAPLLTSKPEVSLVYDNWRRLRSWLKGKEFNAAHDQKTVATISGHVNQIAPH